MNDDEEKKTKNTTTNGKRALWESSNENDLPCSGII